MVCNYPISIFDHYYNDPDAIREYALSLEYTKAPGFFPGYRTECLSTISKEFWELSYQKFLPDNINPDEYVIRSQFQKIYRFSNDPEDPVNSGWIHKDTDTNLAAVLYLDPDPIPDNGTSFYHPKGDNFRFNNVLEGDTPQYERIMGSSANTSGNTNYCKIDDIDWYRENIVKNNEQFEVTMEVKNCYNRCIAYSGQQLHSQSNYWMSNEDDFRLAQVFFVFDLKLPSNFMTSSRLDMFPV